MKVRIEIKCDNAAFEDAPENELARILNRLAEDLKGAPDIQWAHGWKPRDINGNTVGSVTVEA